MHKNQQGAITKCLILIAIILLTIFNSNCFAANVSVNLIATYKTVNYAGKTIQALAFNNQIPGPTLHFKEGDHVTINVYNHLHEGLSVHWHGLILPWTMDGSAGLSQAPIMPGGIFHYQFTLKQSGTYWYHSHACMQQQLGLYGAFIIDPIKSRYHVNNDQVIVLSDWTNRDPEKILENLKKDGDYYKQEYPLQPSLAHFIQLYRQDSPADRQQLKDAYSMMETMRMSPYDISDVPFDAFLFNGQTTSDPWKTAVKVGDIERLRFINAASSSTFQIKIPGKSLKIIAVDGNDLVPYSVNDFAIAPGETYDVLVKIIKPAPAIIYAESVDQLGAAVGVLCPIQTNGQYISSCTTQAQLEQAISAVQPFPEPKPLSMMSGMDMSGMNMSGMDMSGSSMAGMNMSPSSMNNSTTSGSAMTQSPSVSDSNTKYQQMISLVKTNDPSLPVQVIQIQLNGYMGRFVWFFNGIPEYKAKPILIIPGKRYRLIFINETMMYHPMHVHGHWFILRNGHGAYDPLVHTIDVPPEATMVADLDANAGSGIWYFHCHNLYHMMAGMTTEFEYPNTVTTTQAEYTFSKMSSMCGMHDMGGMSNIPKDMPNTNVSNNTDSAPYIPAIPVEQGHIYDSNFLDINGDFNQSYQATINEMIGTDNDKLQLYSNEAEIKNNEVDNADADLFYWHGISEFWAIKGGANFVYRPAQTPYWQPGIGIEGLAPYFIDTDIRSYLHDGSVKLDIDLFRDSQILNNFFIRTGLRSILASKTIMNDDIGSGVNDMEYTLRPYYRLMPGLSIYAQYQYTDYYGATRTSRCMNNLSTSDSLLSLGFAVLF